MSPHPPASEPAPRPPREAVPPPSRRALGVDVARALALVGMIAAHVFPSDDADGDMTLAYGIAAGRASALFAVLAGVSIAFVEKRSRGQLAGRTLAADRAALTVRGLLILLVGLLLGHLDTPIETIIPYFGVLFLVAIPFYGRSCRFLLFSAILFAVLGPILRHLLNGRAPEQVDIEADYTLVTAAQQPLPFLADMLVTGFYPVVSWMVYLCVGMVIGRQVLTSRKLALQLMGWGTALALVTWSTSKILLGPVGGFQRLVEATPTMDGEDIADVLAYGPSVLMPNTTWWWLTAVAPHSETSFNILHTLGSALAVLGLTLFLARGGHKVFTTFAALGAMTLTLYSTHCIILMLEILDEDRPVVSLWTQMIAFMVYALMWRSSMGRGPLEAIISEASDWVRWRVRGTRPVPPSPDSVERSQSPRPVGAAR